MASALVEPLLDHLVLATRDLEQTVSDFTAATGIRPVEGGRHEQFGTRNYLVALGPLAYLEIAGPDADNPMPAAKLPFGMGAVRGSRLLTWSVRPPSLEAAVRAAAAEGVDLGPIRTVGRVTPAGSELNWRIAAAEPAPYDGLVPFLLDWGTTRHPAESGLPTVELLDFRATHPRPAEVAGVLAALGVSLLIEPGKTTLEATVAGPAGTYLMR
ncbi:VOC family protein [Kribbella solani]|uniref:VOC family protein n=1 Tax=Kribbella solani TaxID=236067 RepID=UPI0029AA1D08|nr:VOC family protein [Kribbella solani]MDX2972087.1 VOC family protein [Kribbella solani]MDX3001793.1 VOC family protein [Kribbella solani]